MVRPLFTISSPQYHRLMIRFNPFRGVCMSDKAQSESEEVRELEGRKNTHRIFLIRTCDVPKKANMSKTRCLWRGIDLME